MSAYRGSSIVTNFKMQNKIFFDATYIERMKAYHNRVYHLAMPPESLDIDELQAEAIRDYDMAELQARL